VADRPDLAIALLDNSPEDLRALAQVLERPPEPDSGGPPARPVLARQARDRALDLLKGRCAGSDPAAQDLASLGDMLQERGDFAAAVVEYRRALALSFDQVDWRFRLAKALAALGRPSEALREAEACLRLRPGWIEAEQLAAGLRAAAEKPPATP
jgi:tetratricopeptide (TPR) repeat protein